MKNQWKCAQSIGVVFGCAKLEKYQKWYVMSFEEYRKILNTVSEMTKNRKYQKYQKCRKSSKKIVQLKLIFGICTPSHQQVVFVWDVTGTPTPWVPTNFTTPELQSHFITLIQIMSSNLINGPVLWQSFCTSLPFAVYVRLLDLVFISIESTWSKATLWC